MWKFYCRTEIQFSRFFFVLFCVQDLCCNDLKYHSLNWKDVSVTNVDIFEKEQFSLQFFSSLLQVYIVYRVSFIFHLNAFLVPVCTRGFAHLFCWPRRRGIGLVCTRRFSFPEFYNFLLFIFVNYYYYFFFGRHFFTHDIYPHPHPRSTTSTDYPRHLATLQLNGLWLTKQNRNIVLSALKGVHYLVHFGGRMWAYYHETSLKREWQQLSTV